MNIYIVLKVDYDFLCMTLRPEKMDINNLNHYQPNKHPHLHTSLFVSKANIIMLKGKKFGKTICNIYDNQNNYILNTLKSNYILC